MNNYIELPILYSQGINSSYLKKSIYTFNCNISNKYIVAVSFWNILIICYNVGNSSYIRFNTISQTYFKKIISLLNL
jgi:hypothetical protein